MQTTEECWAKAKEYEQRADESETDSMKEIFEEMAQIWRSMAQTLNAEQAASANTEPH